MDRKKKNGFVFFLYFLLVLLCFGMVWLISGLRDQTVLETREEERTENRQTEESRENETQESSAREEPETVKEDAQELGTKEAVKDNEKEKEAFLAQTEESNENQEKVPVYEPPVLVLISDTHYFSDSLTDYGESFQDMVHRDDGKVVFYNSQLMDAFAWEMEKLRPDGVIVSGDLTLNGEQEGHMAFAEKLRVLEEKGIPVLVIPGNHDINNPNAASYFGEKKEKTDSIDAQEFYEIYREFGYDEAVNRDPHSLSYLYPLDEKNWLLMLDSAQYDPVNLVGGRIRQETIEWMEEILSQAEEQGIQVLPVAHHNLLRESALYETDCTLENSEEVTELLESYGIPVYISGHLHLQRTKTYKREPGEEAGFHISEIVSDSFAIPPCQYGVLQWKGGGGLIYCTKETDVEGWARIQGSADENLLHFKEFGEEFLTEIISAQTSKRIASVLPEEQIKEMSHLYGLLNRAYCSGILINEEEVKSSEAYRLWERNLPDSPMMEEMGDILRDTKEEHNSYEIPQWQ